MEALDASERRARRYAIDKDETFAVAYPLVTKCDVLFLAGCIEYLEHARLAIDLDLFAVRILDGWIVGLDEMIETELRWSVSGALVTTGSTMLTCMVKAVLPTPPSPRTTSLYRVILPAMVPAWTEKELAGCGRLKMGGGRAEEFDARQLAAHVG